MLIFYIVKFYIWDFKVVRVFFLFFFKRKGLVVVVYRVGLTELFVIFCRVSEVGIGFFGFCCVS